MDYPPKHSGKCDTLYQCFNRCAKKKGGAEFEEIGPTTRNGATFLITPFDPEPPNLLASPEVCAPHSLLTLTFPTNCSTGQNPEKREPLESKFTSYTAGVTKHCELSSGSDALSVLNTLSQHLFHLLFPFHVRRPPPLEIPGHNHSP